MPLSLDTYRIRKIIVFASKTYFELVDSKLLQNIDIKIDININTKHGTPYITYIT